MEFQRMDMTVKQPTPLRVHFPQALMLHDNEEEFRSRYPSPPPPTPCVPRRETPLDAQRYDPFKVMLAATSPPRYSSPDLDSPDTDYKPAHLALLSLATTDAYDDLLEYHLGNYNESSDELTSDSGDETPTDESDTPGTTNYRVIGVSTDGDFLIDRTIVRPPPTPTRRRKFDLSRSLVSLATCSTATLRTMPSFSHLSGATTPSSGEEEHDGAFAPPASCVASRRPSLAVAGTPLAIGEVTESLKRLAARIVPGHSSHAHAQTGVDSEHFEEMVDRYEDVWAREERGEPRVEVMIERTRETTVEYIEDAAEADTRGDGRGAGHSRGASRKVGIFC
ncbi:hypothetical protein BC628DRAFT_1317778 [Trametes gibbosa]|nr:hypothetical protein BC628DRAFT_1317778 [Trametes gibbosa]